MEVSLIGEGMNTAVSKSAITLGWHKNKQTKSPGVILICTPLRENVQKALLKCLPAQEDFFFNYVICLALICSIKTC